MKRVAALIMAAGVACAGAVAQPPSRVFTQPVVPTPEVLDRLNLRLGWRVTVPMFGQRDGIASIQAFGGQVVVQSRSGAVVSLDAATGAVQWMARVSDPYPTAQPVGDSESQFLLPEGTRIHGLNRTTGREEWMVDLPATPSSPPDADADRFYVTLTNGRLSAYAFPGAPPPAGTTAARSGAARPAGADKEARTINTAASANINDPRTRSGASAPSGGYGRTVTVSSSIQARTATATGVIFSNRAAIGNRSITRQTRDAVVGDQPVLLWDHQTNLRIQCPPALGTDAVLVVATDGTVLVMLKQGAEFRPWRRVLDAPVAPVTAPPGQSGDDVYVAAESGSVYAFHLPSRAEYARLTANSRDELEPPITWRFGANAPVRFGPIVCGEDLYIVPETGGLIRLNRATGERWWTSPTAKRFLAANPKFVYATDALGRLLVLDRARGTVLSALDTSAFVWGAVNDQTDRVILGANDGTVIALHDRAYPAPLAQHAPPAAPPAKPAGETPEKADGTKPAEEAKPSDGTPKEK
jgi:outer membrane protein assembly factor BamB